MTQWKIGDRVQPKGRPERAGTIVCIDNGGRCGGVSIRFDRQRPGASSGRYSLANVEAAREPIGDSCHLRASS